MSIEYNLITRDKEYAELIKATIEDLASDLPPFQIRNVELVDTILDNSSIRAQAVPITGGQCDLLISSRLLEELVTEGQMQQARHAINHELCHCVDAVKLSGFINPAEILKRDFASMSVNEYYISLGCEFWGEYFACRSSASTYVPYSHFPLTHYAKKAKIKLYIANEQIVSNSDINERRTMFTLCNPEISWLIYHVVHAIGESHGSSSDIRREELNSLVDYDSKAIGKFYSWVNDIEEQLLQGYTLYSQQNFGKSILLQIGECIFSLYMNHGIHIIDDKAVAPQILCKVSFAG
jgi:hypothetical protein